MEMIVAVRKNQPVMFDGRAIDTIRAISMFEEQGLFVWRVPLSRETDFDMLWLSDDPTAEPGPELEGAYERVTPVA